jgi:hypothetical protein
VKRISASRELEIPLGATYSAWMGFRGRVVGLPRFQDWLLGCALCVHRSRYSIRAIARRLDALFQEVSR